jgi:hypothetical protein
VATENVGLILSMRCHEAENRAERVQQLVELCTQLPLEPGWLLSVEVQQYPPRFEGVLRERDDQLDAVRFQARRGHGDPPDGVILFGSNSSADRCNGVQ